MGEGQPLTPSSVPQPPAEEGAEPAHFCDPCTQQPGPLHLKSRQHRRLSTPVPTRVGSTFHQLKSSDKLTRQVRIQRKENNPP